MIKITDNLWIGDSSDERHADFDDVGINAVLNVAQDLHASRGWTDEVEYMQVGLMDGPGNTPAAYIAAVLALSVLLHRKRVLVCCHTGSRSMAIALVYMIVKRGKTSSHPTFLNYWVSWDTMYDELLAQVGQLPIIHDSHKEVANNLPFSLFESLL